MKLTGLDVFDTTIEKTTEWLQDLMHELNWSDRRETYVALRFVLRGLRDHLNVDQAVRLGNQLPMLIRGAYFEEWHPAEKPLPCESRDALVANICTYFTQNGEPDTEGERIVRGVFRLLEKKVTEGELEDLSDILPHHLLELWPPKRHAA